MYFSVLWKSYVLTVIFWVTKPYGVVGGYWHFEGLTALLPYRMTWYSGKSLNLQNQTGGETLNVIY